MPNLPSVVVMSGAENKKTNKKKVELDWKKKRLNRFLIVSMLNVPSVVVISGAENGKLQTIRYTENKRVRLSKIDVKLTVCGGYLLC